MTRSFIGYPAGWTLSVMGDLEAAEGAAAELHAAGIGANDVIVLAGANGADQITKLGTSTGVAARIRRGVQFVTMDQMPDLHVYELAMEQGDPLLGIRVADTEKRRRAIEILRRHGAHFINRFGDWATEEISPWRGRMPDLPQHMQR
jgi:hypothetical protein